MSTLFRRPTDLRRKIAVSLVAGSLTLSATLLGVRAMYADVPHGLQPGAPQTTPVTSSDEDFLNRASHAFNRIAEKAMPAVVSISTIRADRRMLGIGSGILIRNDGLILTNNHVIDEARKVTVVLDDKHKISAHVVGADPNTDLALVQIDGPKRSDYPVISFGDSEQVHEGDWAIAIGSPFGLTRSVSFGIISAKSRAQMGILDVEDFIQTDAAINPGSSGGPLLNAKGELVGVNTAIFSEGGGNMGIGFAIPSKIAHEISDDLISHGHVPRGWVGMTAQDLDPELAHYFKVPDSKGALVSGLAPKGPAHAALQTGDVITHYDHQTIDGAATLKKLVGKTSPGKTVPIELVRDGQPKNVSLAIQEQPLSRPPRSLDSQRAGILGGGAPLPEKPRASFGLDVEDVPEEISGLLHLSPREGTIVVAVNPNSPAFDAGIGPGDIILSANRTEIHGAREFKHLTQNLKERQVAVLYVQRGPSERVFVPVKYGAPEA